MQQLTGSYIWHYVSEECRISGVKENREYLVCFEVEEIEDDGFYIIDDIGGSKGPRCFKLRGVRYWTEIHEPGVNPDDTLTIVG